MAKPFKPGFFSNLNGIKDNNDRPPLAGGSGGTTNTFTNLGTGARVFAALVGADVRFRTITVGPNLAVAETADNVNITFTGALGEVNTVSNLGTTGARVFSAKTGADFALRRIIAAAGSGITVTENTNDISIGTNAGVLASLIAPLLALGETNTASNRGAGEGVFAAKVGVDLQFKSLVAGPNVTLTSDANTITIASSGGGGGSSTPPLMVGTLEGVSVSTTAYATKGVFVIPSTSLTVKGIWFWVDPAATTETYVCNISETSGTIVGSTVTSIIATGGVTQATGTIGEVLFSLFPSPVTLTAGTYLFSVTQTSGTPTTTLRLGSPSTTTGYVTLGTPLLKYNLGSNTPQIASNNLTVGDAVGNIGASQGYGVFPII